MSKTETGSTQSRSGRRPAAREISKAKLTDTPPAPVSKGAVASFDETRGPSTLPANALPARRGFSFGKLLLSGFTGLVGLGFGLWVDSLIADLFTRSAALGYVGLGLAALFVLGVIGLATREILALSRLSSVKNLRDQAILANDTGDLARARDVTRSLIRIYDGQPETARARSTLLSHLDDVMDGKDQLELTERQLLEPLDQRAANIIMQSARRTSIVTALAPRAIIDVAFVVLENMRLVRRLAQLYGARPGFLGFLSLSRSVLAHLAVTGGLSASDGFIQDALGHGLAAKVSARLGEGVINGMLTARVGRAAMAVIRPMPFIASQPPSLGNIAAELARTNSDAEPDQDGRLDVAVSPKPATAASRKEKTKG